MESKPSKPLDIIVSDLKTMPTVGTGGAVYAGSAIDHKTKYLTLTFLKTKDEWPQKYEQVINWFKNKLGRTHKEWRSDGAKEFVSKDMQVIQDREGIQVSTTPPHMPNKNPSERIWRTLIEAIAAMIITAGMSVKYWVQAPKYFTYMYNRTPAKDGKSPFEKMFKRKPHSVTLYPWGCLCYVHNHVRSKKEIVKATPAWFAGIDHGGRYECISLKDGTVMMTDSITVVKQIFPKGRHKHLMNFDLSTVCQYLQLEEQKILTEVRLGNRTQALEQRPPRELTKDKETKFGDIQGKVFDESHVSNPPRTSCTNPIGQKLPYLSQFLKDRQ